MAAAVLSKTTNLRRAYRLFSCYSPSRRITPHSFNSTPIHRHQSDLGSFSKLPRFQSTNASADSPLKETTASDSRSHQENQSGEQGKSVRGGPISWLSFLLLVATGAGVIFYYDQEKKRHIEGR